MKNLILSKSLYIIIILLIIVGTIVGMLLILSSPPDFKPKENSEKIKAEMISRIENVAELRNSIGFISFTPFLWDEGYYFNGSVNETVFKSFVQDKSAFKNLSEDEQRLIFYCKGQETADLIFMKSDINFNIQTGRVENDLYKISILPDGTIQLHE